MLTITKNVREIRAGGHYGLAVSDGNYVYLSGQFSVSPDTGEKRFGTIETETAQVLRNIALILEEAGSDKDHVLKTTVFIKDLAQWGAVDRLYKEFFGEHTPARSVLAVADLHYGFQVEMEVVACCRGSASE